VVVEEEEAVKNYGCNSYLMELVGKNMFGVDMESLLKLCLMVCRRYHCYLRLFIQIGDFELQGPVDQFWR
jgi:hypothetical protein